MEEGGLLPFWDNSSGIIAYSFWLTCVGASYTMDGVRDCCDSHALGALSGHIYQAYS